MATRYELRLSGAGGQGLILAGVILAEAAAIYDGKNAVQSQSYGPEARGGASKSEVIISTDDSQRLVNTAELRELDGVLGTATATVLVNLFPLYLPLIMKGSMDL